MENLNKRKLGEGKKRKKTQKASKSDRFFCSLAPLSPSPPQRQREAKRERERGKKTKQPSQTNASRIQHNYLALISIAESPQETHKHKVMVGITKGGGQLLLLLLVESGQPMSLYDALLLFGVVVGRLNKHTTPKRKEKKKGNGFVQLHKEHQIDFKEDAWRVQKEEKGNKSFW
jgi:hypothetical protein